MEYLKLLSKISILIFLTQCASTSRIEKKTAPYGAIPARPHGALSGSEFIKRIRYLNAHQRETAILTEFRRGNIPSFMRSLKPVRIRGKYSNHKPFIATMWIMPDYLSIGHDDDFVRVPMNPLTAQKIADHFGFLLPTTAIVDAIHRQADLKLNPTTFKPNTKMATTQSFWFHNQKIQKQLAIVQSSGIIAGHKKDIVISNRLQTRKGRVAIYGWHRRDGRIIQPLSTVHDQYYADYSHGVRLISNVVHFGKRELPLVEILADNHLAQYFTGEGKISIPRVCTAC